MLTRDERIDGCDAATLARAITAITAIIHISTTATVYVHRSDDAVLSDIREQVQQPARGRFRWGPVQTLSRKVGRCDRQSVLKTLGFPKVTCPQVQRIRDQSPPSVNR